MSVEQVQRAVRLELDKTDSLNYASFLPEEIDYWINQGELTFIKTRYTGNNTRGESFEQTQKRIDDLRPLVTDSNISLTKGLDITKTNAYIGVLPSDYMFMLGEQSLISVINDVVPTGTSFTAPYSKYYASTPCVIDNGVDTTTISSDTIFTPSLYFSESYEGIIYSVGSTTSLGKNITITINPDYYTVGQSVIVTFESTVGTLGPINTTIRSKGASNVSVAFIKTSDNSNNPYTYARSGQSVTLYPATYTGDVSLVSGKCYTVTQTMCPVTQITIDRFKDSTINPFSEHNYHYGKANPLRLFKTSSVELYSDGNYIISEYYLRYLRFPRKFNSIVDTYQVGDTLESGISYIVGSGSGVIYDNITYTTGNVFTCNDLENSFTNVNNNDPSTVQSLQQGLDLPEHTHDEIVKITVNKMLENIGYTDRYQTHTIEARSME